MRSKKFFPEGLLFSLQFALALYAAGAVALHFALRINVRWQIYALCAAILCAAIFWLLRRAQLPEQLLPRRSAVRARLSRKVFAAAACVTLLCVAPFYAAHFPGSIHIDFLMQLRDIQQGALHDWHPAFHTMLIWLGALALRRYFLLVAAQVLCYALAAGWLAATLRAWGFHWGWAALEVFLLCALQSARSAALFIMKDSTFMLLVLVAAGQALNLYCSRGAWLRRRGNCAAFTLNAAALMLVRHNGLFYAAPLLAGALGGVRNEGLGRGGAAVSEEKRLRRRALLCAGLAGLTVFLVRVPLYRLMRVQNNPAQTKSETNGLPMTILCGVYLTQPEALDPGTRAFMESIAPPEVWARAVFGSYNSIKHNWVGNMGVEAWQRTDYEGLMPGPFADIPETRVFFMAWRALRAAPAAATHAALELTKLVWDPFIHGPVIENWRVFPQDAVQYNLPYQDEIRLLPDGLRGRLLEFANLELQAGRILTFDNAWESVGLCTLLLLVCGVQALARRRAYSAALLFAPPVCYNLATMLLLAGPDTRFFIFNAAAALPLCLGCVARVREHPLEESGIRG